MPVLGLDHVNIRVPLDLLEPVRTFYVQLLGLSDGFRPPFGSTGHWLYAGGHPVIHLSVQRKSDAAAATGGTVDHIAFKCSDYSATCAQLTALGVEYRSADVPLVGQRQLFLRDPAGNGVELNFARDS